MKYISADYIKELMKNNRFLQGNAEYELWKQQVDKIVDAMPGIKVSDEEDRTEWVKVDKSGLMCVKCGSIFRSRGCTKIPKHCPECGKKTIGVAE